MQLAGAGTSLDHSQAFPSAKSSTKIAFGLETSVSVSLAPLLPELMSDRQLTNAWFESDPTANPETEQVAV